MLIRFRSSLSRIVFNFTNSLTPIFEHHYSKTANHLKLLPDYCCTSFVFVNNKNRRMATNSNAKTALVIIAEGSEEIEAVTPIDVMRRAGITVTVAGLQGSGTVLCSRNVNVVPDLSLQDALSKAPYDVIVLPGGLKGAESFGDSQEVGKALKEQETSGRLVAAICAAPTALKKHGIAVGKSITSYPSTKEFMEVGNVYKYKEDRVVIDGNLITSRGPGTAMEFALALVEYLVGQEKRNEVAKGLLFKE